MKQKFERTLRLGTLFTFMALFTSCYTYFVNTDGRDYFSEKVGAIPCEFGEQKSTLVFVTHHPKYNRMTTRNVEKTYNGDFIFASQEMLENDDLFKNKVKYRYAFDFDESSSRSVYEHPNGFEESRVSILYKYKIIDRLNNQTYRARKSSNSYQFLQKIYLLMLNKKNDSWTNK